jgi:hypothetical protein
MERNIALTLAALALLAIVVAIIAPGGRQVDPEPKVPWRIEVQPDGSSSVLGLTLGRSTLADARRVFDEGGELTLFAEPDGDIAVEAFFEGVFLSGLRADIVLSLMLPAKTLEGMYDRGRRSSRLGSGEHKVTLHPDDVQRASTAPVGHITYLPVADPEPDLLESRFGPPARRIPTGRGIEHWLYPDRGLDIVVDPEGKEVFQYVPPRDFQPLVVAPLEAHADAGTP